MDLESGEARLLAEIGFLGISRGEHEAAARLFESLVHLRPAEEVGTIGQGLATLALGLPMEAARLLSQGPQTEAVITFAVVARCAAGDRAEARVLLEDLEAMQAPAPLLDIARAALDDAGPDQAPATPSAPPRSAEGLLR